MDDTSFHSKTLGYITLNVFLNNFSHSNPTPFTFSGTTNHKNPSPRTGPQDLLVTLYDCAENEQKTLHKYAINQITQCESEPHKIETTNIVATLYSKVIATTLTGYKFKATFSEKKVHCSQVSNGNKKDLIRNLSIKVISKKFYILALKIVGTNLID